MNARTTVSWRRGLWLVICTSWAFAGGAAWGAVTTVPNIPDFYQHQYWEKLATGVAGNEAKGGYCYPVSIVDALYPWKVQADYAGLFHDDIATTAKWGPAARDAVDAVINPGKWNINTYIKTKGFEPAKILEGKPSLLSMTYVVDQATGVVSVELAGGRQEVVKKDGANVKAFDLYVDHLQRGRTGVARVKVPLDVNGDATESYNNLWWWYSFHAMSAAGYDAAGRIMQVADPDSNKGNQADRAGWYNLNADGTWDKSDDGIIAAKTRVGNNMYTAADLGADVPLPGNNNGVPAAYTHSDLYAQLQVNADGYTIDASDGIKDGDPGVWDTGRYKGTKLWKIETISPTLGALDRPVRLAVNKFRATIKLLGDLVGSIDKIKIFPTTTIDVTDPDFFFDLPGWTPSLTYDDPFGDDPLGYDRLDGGLELSADPGTFLLPGESGLAMFNVTSKFNGFDMFFHDYDTNTWFVQAIGARRIPGGPQTQIPEPASAVGAAWFVALAALFRRRRVEQRPLPFTT